MEIKYHRANPDSKANLTLKKHSGQAGYKQVAEDLLCMSFKKLGMALYRSYRGTLRQAQGRLRDEESCIESG
ncbi:MAG: hypothetical protein COV67_13945 [Nitrospinae bacterium CG11_big_fil_rev_8_21_14_0_20_56_8]|nr:MAG: hypothetical protein COV67_13945 [Nitrospinae bacterium CG11_big_fil_rev_8_21_14_0_20_56_8]